MRRVVIALLLLVLAACGPATSGTASSPASEAPATVAPVPAGYPAEAFRVAAPMVFFGGSPIPPQLPACAAAQVVAKGATIRTVGGVDGVIQLDGPSCSLDIRIGPTELLDTAGHSLDITLDPVPPAQNPPMSRGGYFALALGHVLWGFAVDGSWCGAAPAFVVLPLTPDNTTAAVTDIRVPLIGPAPACKGQSDAELRPGVAGNEANADDPPEAVLPVPSEWSGLHLALHVDSVTSGGALVGLSATISNPTGSPIALSPCPSYELVVTEGNGDSVRDGTLGCSEPRVLAAGAGATYPVDGRHFGEGDPGIATGGAVKIQLAIAGVPTATATSQVG